MSDDDEDIELGEPDELIVYNQSMSVIAELKSRVRELEAERDLLRKDNETLLNHATEMAKALGKERDDSLRLRTRHAALVEKYNELLDV